MQYAWLWLEWHQLSKNGVNIANAKMVDARCMNDTKMCHDRCDAWFNARVIRIWLMHDENCQDMPEWMS